MKPIGRTTVISACWSGILPHRRNAKSVAKINELSASHIQLSLTDIAYHGILYSRFEWAKLPYYN